MAQEELSNLMTILYIGIQSALNDPDKLADARERLVRLNPSLPNFMLLATSKLRWDDGAYLPQSQVSFSINMSPMCCVSGFQPNRFL